MTDIEIIIRQTSDIIQALENLINQCEGDAYFNDLQKLAIEVLPRANARLRELIHAI